MGKQDENVKPNYKLLLETYIGSVQVAYIAYRRAYTKYLENTWINNEGEFCFSPTLSDKVVEKYDEYHKAVEELGTFKMKYGRELGI